jgi:hypothetical protein
LKSKKECVPFNQNSTNKKLEATKFEDYKKDSATKMEAVNDKLRDFIKKFEPTLDKFNNDTQRMDAKITKLETKIVHINISILTF